MDTHSLFRQIEIRGIHNIPDLKFTVLAIRPSYITIEFDTGTEKIVICNQLDDYTNAHELATITLITANKTKWFDCIIDLCKYLQMHNIQIISSSMKIFETELSSCNDCVELWYPVNGNIAKYPLRSVLIKLREALISHGL